MLPTFVIGLREGLEAALIVGIIAAFLRKQGRRDLLRWVMTGVGVAVVLCLAAGIALDVVSHNLPQKQQEGLETVIGFVAVGMVTYMVVWMRRNSRNLKGQLEGLAADALTGRSNAGRAMILMAFLAVIREGLETVVFLLAAFDEANNARSAGIGVVLGIAVAVALGYGIYRGGVRINLSKFFRATGFVLVLVAAGIVVNALHTAHEAGWLQAGQRSTVDLSWLVQPGSVQSSLLTGMLGVQAHPVVAEVVGWLVYLIPVGLYVVWPPGRGLPARTMARITGGVGVAAALAAVVLGLLAPAAVAQRPATSARVAAGAVTAVVTSRGDQIAGVRTQSQQPLTGSLGAPRTFSLAAAGEQRHAGVPTQRYAATMSGSPSSTSPSSTSPSNTSASRPAQLPIARVAALNGGRLPLSAARSGQRTIPVTYRDRLTLTAWLDTATDRVVDLSWTEQETVVVQTASDREELSQPIATATSALPAATVARAAAAADADRTSAGRRDTLLDLTGVFGAVAAVALVLALGLGLAAYRSRTVSDPVHRDRPAELVRS